MSRYRDPQLQVTENLSDLQNLSPNIDQCFKIESIFYFVKLVIQVLIEGQNVYCRLVDISVLRVEGLVGPQLYSAGIE